VGEFNHSVRGRRSVWAITAWVGLTLSGSGYAQQPDQDEGSLDEVVVTGSRIPRTGFETLQPATVLNSEQLELRNAFNVADVLNEQAGFAVSGELGESPVGRQDGASVGQNYVNYLGLGPQRTLTLVNGQRFPAGTAPNGNGGLSVDLNAIPELLIDRVETIAVGGAPIYGSDAIAGTVNIIMRDDYEGFDLNMSLGGSTEYGGSTEERLAATWGTNFADGRGNIALAASYSSTPGLKWTARKSTETDWGFESPADPNSPFDNQLFPDLRVAVDNTGPFPLFSGNQFAFNLFGNGIPLNPGDPDSPLSQFDADGNLTSFIPGGGTGSVIFQNGGDGIQLAKLTSLYAELERYNANVFFNYDITDSVRFKAEGWFARTDAVEVVNQAEYNSPAFGGLPGDSYQSVGNGPIPVRISNPFIPEGTRTTIQAALDIAQDFNGDGMADPTLDTNGDGVADTVGFWRGGPNTSFMGENPEAAQRDTIRGVFGLEGDVAIGNRDFFWDAGVTFGRTESDDISLIILQSNFEQAIDVIDDGNGNPVCVDPSNGCVALNVIGTATPEAAAFVSARVTDKVTVEQQVFSANIGGDIFDLPAGSVGFAGGFVYREEEATYTPNSLNDLAREPATAITGKFDSTEFYFETVVPLLGGDLDTPLVETLEFEGAVRFVDNSIAGKDTTWTAGLRYRPIDDIEFRGNLTESIRAPSITELFTPESTFNDFANDPCDARFISQGNVPSTRAANCAADGITQPFTSFIVNASQSGTLSGNPTLDSEIAESSTFGVILRPRFLEGLTASIDWFDIEIANAIESLTVQDLMVACYDSSAGAAEPSCDRFSRDANGQVSDFSSGFVNVGLVEFTGVQTDISYAFEMGRFGDMALSLTHLYTDQHIETPGSGNSVQKDGLIGRSDNRVTATSIWNFGKWRLFNQFRWLSDAVFNNADTATTRDVLGVDSFFVVDAGLSYSFSESLTLQLNVDNLLNEKPPYAGVAAAAGRMAYISGVLERYATVSVRASF
jgi:iron complex outermembrane receptor protein